MIPSYLLPGIPGIFYYLYYKTYCRKIPEIYGGDGAFLNLLRRTCPILQEEYRPTPLIHGSRLMTIFSSFTRHRGLHYPFLREIFVCSDGGEVALDWWDPKTNKPTVTNKHDKPLVACNEQDAASTSHSDESASHLDFVVLPDIAQTTSLSDTVKEIIEEPEVSGIVLVLPGLTGDSTRNYVKGLVQVIEGQGLTAVVLNYRGVSTSLKTPRTYCGSDTSDIAAVVEHIKKRYPAVPLIAVGVSLGGMLLINYLAKCGKENLDSRLIGGFAVSVPWNIAEASKVLEQPLNWLLFNRSLANALCAAVYRHSDMLRTSPIDFGELKNINTIKQFDDKITAKIFGFSGVDAYYSSATCHNKVDLIHTPLLCLNAADDMFSPYESIPKEAAKANPNVCIVVTSHGGHIGFLEGWPFGVNYVERIFEQFVKALHADMREKMTVKQDDLLENA